MSGTRDSDQPTRSETRAVSPVVGVLAFVAITVCAAIVVVLGIGAWSLESPGPTATFDLSAEGDGSSVAIEHVAGDPIDVETLSVTIAINGTELAAQPPVPFVGANGFDGTPDGPFNARADSEWTVGERARVSIAETNTPTPAPGDAVTVTLAVEDRRVADLETTAT